MDAHRSFLLQPQGPVTHRGRLQQLDRWAERRRAGISERCCNRQTNVFRTNASTCVSGYAGIRNLGATVVVAVFRRAGSNAVEVAKSVRELLPTIQAQLPSSVLLVPAYDRSQTIVSSIKDVQATLYIAFVLVVLVIFVFLGRATDTLIPAVALPLSLLLTFIAMRCTGLQPG